MGSQGGSDDELLYWFLSNITEVEKVLLHFDAGNLMYWVNKIPMFPRLSKTALKILATLASYSSSKQDFSDLKAMLSSRRTLVKGEIIDEVLLVRSFLTKQ